MDPPEAAKVSAIGALTILLLLPSMWVDGVIGEQEDAAERGP